MMVQHSKLADILHNTRARSRIATSDIGTPIAVSNWLDMLPIAAAIFEFANGSANMISHNHLFEKMGLNSGKGKSPHHIELAAYIQAVAENEGAVRVFNWTAPDSISRRRFDITVAKHTVGGEQHAQYLLSFMDRTATAENELNMRREMMSDSLTGLANRSGFEEQIENSIEASLLACSAYKPKPKFAILSVDLSRFSQVNECAGAIVGDELIISVASRLRSSIRKHDLLARLGGNEFGIFVELCEGQEDASLIIERIEAAFANPYRLSQLETQVDAAMGVAIGTMGKDNAPNILRYAQIALKQAKQKNRTTVYEPSVLVQARRRFTLECDLRIAIAKDRLHLEYQPLIDLNSGQITGFEALARWNDPDRGNVSPVTFIPVAEECGLIVPLGRWAMHSAAKTLADWDSKAGRKLPLRVNVNLSAVQFVRDNIASVVEEAIRHTHIDGNCITLELTESVILSDPDRAIKVMQSLKNLDTSLAMDDFGTGYSNLAYLQKLPIDILKIDRSFVTKMLEDKDKVSIVRAVLSLADTLDMQTTAEGIESIELSHTLAALGCSHGQGFYFARPLSADKAYSYYQKQLSFI